MPQAPLRQALSRGIDRDQALLRRGHRVVWQDLVLGVDHLQGRENRLICEGRSRRRTRPPSPLIAYPRISGDLAPGHPSAGGGARDPDLAKTPQPGPGLEGRRLVTAKVEKAKLEAARLISEANLEGTAMAITDPRFLHPAFDQRLVTWLE
jgi:hypothetical protein